MTSYETHYLKLPRHSDRPYKKWHNVTLFSYEKSFLATKRVSLCHPAPSLAPPRKACTRPRLVLE